jgi:hypothetical protein
MATIKTKSEFELPEELQSKVDFMVERYKNFNRNTRNWNAKFELFKRYYEGYQYEDDNLGDGKTMIKDVMDRQRSRSNNGSDQNVWKFRINDNIVQEIVDYFLVDYVITDPSFDMDAMNDDTKSVQVAKSIDRILKHVKEVNGFSVKNLEAALLCILTGSVYMGVFQEDDEISIDYFPYDKIIDDGIATDLEKSDFIIRVHDLPLYVFQDQFKKMYKEMYGDEDPYKKSSSIETASTLNSLDHLYSVFDAVKQYTAKVEMKKVRVLECLDADGRQIFMVETGEEQFEFAGIFESPYPMKFNYVRIPFKLSPLSAGGSTFMADIIEVQNAVNFITSQALNNAVEQSNPKRFIADDVFFRDQDGQESIIGPKSQTFRYTPSLTNPNAPVIFYDTVPVLSAQLYQAKQDLIDRTYKRLNITPAARGMLPASRTSSKALEFLTGQRNNQSQAYMILYKNALQSLAKKIIQMAKQVYKDEKLIRIVGQDSVYAVEEFKKYLPDDPNIKIVAGTEVDEGSSQKQALILQLLQYGGEEIFNNDALMRVLGMNRDESFRPPAEADRNLAIMQIAKVLAGEETPNPEKGQNHLVFVEEINKLKKTKNWFDADDTIKANIDKMSDAHLMAQRQEVYELQLMDAQAKQQAQDIAQQSGLVDQQPPAPTQGTPPAPQTTQPAQPTTAPQEPQLVQQILSQMQGGQQPQNG